MVPPGRDGRGGSTAGSSSSRHSDSNDGLGGQTGLELTAYGEVEAAGGGDPAGRLDGVRAETFRLLGLEAQLVTRDGGGLVPAEALVDAGVLVIRLLKVKTSEKCDSVWLSVPHLQILDGARRVVPPGVGPLLVVAASLVMTVLLLLSLLRLLAWRAWLTVRDHRDVRRLRLAPSHRQRSVARELGLDSEASLERLGREGRVGDTTDGTQRRTHPGRLETGAGLLVNSSLH